MELLVAGRQHKTPSPFETLDRCRATRSSGLGYSSESYQFGSEKRVYPPYRSHDMWVWVQLIPPSVILHSVGNVPTNFVHEFPSYILIQLSL